jgi:hypothetical protein
MNGNELSLGRTIAGYSNAWTDARFSTLAGCRRYREEVRALRPGRYLIVKTKRGTAAHYWGIKFALVPESERAEYEAGGADFVDTDAPPPRVSVVSAADAGLDPSAKWYCSCERHSTLLGVQSKRAAQTAARNPADWCEECRAEQATA